MAPFLRNFAGAARRIVPGCITLGQAVAFNMFLGFFPLLLVTLVFLKTSDMFRDLAMELPRRAQFVLPPGSEDVVMDYVLHRGPHPERLMAVGIIGVLLTGTQVMIGLMQGFRVIDAQSERASYFRQQLRALALLCMTLIPWLVVVVLTVFGRQARTWLVHQIGFPNLARNVAAGGSLLIVLVLALGVLMVLYRVGRFGTYTWREVIPGATVATILWWVVDMLFGFYVRHVPYGIVYGGLAAAIGLLLWMYMTAMVIFLGAAYNAARHHHAPAFR
jgi:membrane protein